MKTKDIARPSLSEINTLLAKVRAPFASYTTDVATTITGAYDMFGVYMPLVAYICKVEGVGHDSYPVSLYYIKSRRFFGSHRSRYMVEIAADAGLSYNEAKSIQDEMLFALDRKAPKLVAA